jgi:hypothetical protein
MTNGSNPHSKSADPLRKCLLFDLSVFDMALTYE